MAKHANGLLGLIAPGTDFALLHRPHATGPDRLTILLGEARAVDRVADLPLRSGSDGPDVLALLPYRQLAERGLDCHDDGTPLIAMQVREHHHVLLPQVMRELPRDRAVLRDGRFEPDDDGYAAIVRRVLDEEIGRGEGANFVIRRAFTATVENHSLRTVLAVFRRLLARERGAYWTFLVHCGGRTLVGASPEQFVGLAAGTATMNPISGTYRYPPGGPTVPDVVRFLADRKEAEELYMVVDEELKMLGRICDGGARLTGPHLKEMAHLAHTEYTVAGRTRLGVREVLRETMFAPTVIGSPLANACRVVAEHEGRGRGYYGGALALIGQRDGHRTLDSAILIRTAELHPDGRFEVGVGATLVRRSDPAAEAAETRAKALGLLAAFGAGDRSAAPVRATLDADPRVARALAARNDRLAPFWLRREVQPTVPALAGRRVLVIDAGDAFTAMLAHQLRALGLEVTVRGYDRSPPPHGYEVVLVGPGPGDPRAGTDPKIAALRELTETLVRQRTPVLSVCLGHQVLAGLLGLPICRRPVPAQGEQREIDFFGRGERVGFYNTFAAYADADHLTCPLTGVPVEVGRDRDTSEVYGLRAPRIRSVQFHPESVLTRRGPAILRELIGTLLDVPATAG